MAQRLLHRLLFTIFFWQSQWHSDYYTDFFWQSFLTIPMAQRLLHRLLLAISFDNPNGTATVTQTSFGNFFWQSQWHSDCYTDFLWQSAELRFSYQVCGKGRPSDQTWRPRLVSMKKTCAGNSHATLSPHFFTFIPGPKTQQQLTSHQGRLRFRNSFYKGVVQSKSSQTYDHLQAQYEQNKECKHKCKTTKVLRTKRKCYMNYRWIW